MDVTDGGLHAWGQRPLSLRRRRDSVILAHIRAQQWLSLASYLPLFRAFWIAPCDRSAWSAYDRLPMPRIRDFSEDDGSVRYNVLLLLRTLSTWARAAECRRPRRYRPARCGSCRECGGNWRAARSEHVTLAPVRPRGQETSAREAEKGFPSHRLFASGSALTPGAPRAASARFQRRAARSGS